MRAAPLWMSLALFSLGSGCKREASAPRLTVDACTEASSLPARQQRQVCAALLPRCARELMVTDANAFEIADACGPRYCPDLAPAPRWCAGARGNPLDGFAPELEFVGAALAFEHGAEAKRAALAFSKAMARKASEARAEQQAVEANALLELTLVPGDDGGVRLRVETKAWRVDSERSSALTAAECDEVVRRALDGRPLPPRPSALFRVDKRVPFREVRCLTSALLKAGFDEEELHFAAPPRTAE